MTTEPRPATSPTHEINLVLTAVNRGQRCDTTGLYPDECGCAEHFTDRPTVISLAALERLAGHPLPAYRMRARDPHWKVPDPQRTVCDHRDDDLCGPCSTLLDQLLADLPDLVEQVGIAMRKAVRFPPHGHRRGDTETPDESPIPWNQAAALALGDLQRLIATGRHTSRHALLADLSRAARRAHRVIDRPRDRTFTMCPVCRTELVVPEADPDNRQIVCTTNGCSYSASWDQHQSDLLDANGDAMLTMNDLVLVLTRAGEPMTRDRINNMIRRHGLPREQISDPKWEDGKVVVTEPKWVYRLRDVRELAARIDTRKDT